VFSRAPFPLPHPHLQDAKPILARLRQKYEVQWREGSIPGWGAAESEASSGASLFCEPCNRRFTKATVMQSHLKSKKHKRKAARAGAASGAGAGAAAASRAGAGAGGQESAHARCAWAEMVVTRMLELLSEIMDATKRQAEKKQTRTYQELEAEIEAAEAGDQDSDLEDSEEEDGVLYNPKKLPLGWDGKPIPYWLYKVRVIQCDGG